MNHPPIGEDEARDLERLNAEPWMLAYLELSPGYTGWGPGDHGMSRRDQRGFEIESWSEFKIQLGDYNECVHFYFEVERDADNCETCGHTGYNQATRELDETFYDLGPNRLVAPIGGNVTGRLWKDSLTEDELQALKDHNRVPADATLADVNRANTNRDFFDSGRDVRFIHDSVSRMVIVETRATRLGVFGHCARCDGRGYLHIEPTAHLNVVMWILIPRKSDHFGIRISRLSRTDAAAAHAYLIQAGRRNAERFKSLLANSSDLDDAALEQLHQHEEAEAQRTMERAARAQAELARRRG